MFLLLYRIVLFTILSLTIISLVQAQSIKPSYPDALMIPAGEEAIKTQISVKIEDHTITKVVLLDRNFKSTPKNVKASDNYIFFEVAIEKGINNEFTFLYQKPNSMPQQYPSSIQIFGQEGQVSEKGDSASENMENTDAEKETARTQKSNLNNAKASQNKKNKIEVTEEFAESRKPDYDLTVIAPESLLEKIEKYRVIIDPIVEGGQREEKVFEVKKIGGSKVKSQDIPLKLKPGRNAITIVGETKDGTKLNETQNEISIYCNECSDDTVNINSLYTRAIVGFQQTGASSADSAQKPFLDFFFNAPLINGNRGKNKDKPEEYLHPRLALWGTLRFTSIAQQQTVNNIGLSTFATSFTPTGSDGNINDLVQSFEVLAGLDVKLPEPNSYELFGMRQKTIVSFIASVGFSNPLSSQKSALIFQVPKVNGADNSDFVTLFPEAKGKTNIAFVPSERDRFYRQYYAGLRFKTVRYDEKKMPLNTSPAIFDIVIGQNEAITDSLKGVILRAEGFYPFPIKKADYLYFFGTAQLKLGKQVNRTTLPFILAPVNTISIPNTDTAIVQVSDSPYLRSNRDRYSLGIGIDFIKLYKRLTSGSDKK